MSRRPLVAVAHGTRDPAGRAAVAGVASAVASRLPGVPVRLAWLDHARPTLAEAVAGAGEAVVVPLLLTGGYHLREDIPAVLRGTRARVAAPLGPDPLLATALADRLADTGAPDEAAVVLAGAGSARPAAAADLATTAVALAARLRRPVHVAVLSTGGPPAAAVVTALRGSGRAVALVPLLLTAGRFATAAARAGADHTAAPLGAHPAVVELVARRYADVADAPTATRPGVCASPPNVTH